MRATFLSSVLLASSFSATAAASEEESCSKAHVEAQLLKRDQPDRLLERRAQLLTCASNACPRSIVEACTQWKAEVDQLVPSVFVTVLDEHGADVHGVEIVIDGTRRPSPRSGADGTTIELDPGDHHLVVAAVGHRTEERKVVLRPREQRRATRIILTQMSSTTEAPSPVFTGPTRTIPAESWAFFGVAAAGVAVAGAGFVFALTKIGTLNDDPQRCPSVGPFGADCTGPPSDSVRAAQDDYTTGLRVGWVGLGVGAVSALTGFLLLPSESTTNRASGRARISAGLGSLRVEGKF